MSKIKPGFCVTVESWENDADAWATKTLYGLTESEAQMYMALAYFNSTGDSNLENGYEPNDVEIARGLKAYRNFIEKNRDIFEEFFNKFVDENEFNNDNTFDIVLRDLMGNITGYSEYYYFRVVEKYECSFIPEVVVENRTDEMMKAIKM